MSYYSGRRPKPKWRRSEKEKEAARREIEARATEQRRERRFSRSLTRYATNREED